MKFWSRAVMAAAVALALSAEAGYAAPTVALAAPSRPSSPKATPGDTRVTLTWVQPTSHTPPIDHYTVTGSPGGISATTTTTSYVATGLTNGKLYTFTVKATNADGDGPSSVAVTATPRAVPPDRPRDVAATPGPADGQTTLSWTPPATNGSLPDGTPANIDHYNVTVSPGGISQQVPQSTTTFTAPTPADNITYTFTVSATNNRPLTGAAATAYSPVPSAATLGLNPTSGRLTTNITVTGQLFLKNESITLYWDLSTHVAASVVTDDNGSFTKTVKPFSTDKPKVHKLCASVQPKPCANFTLQAPPTPSPQVTPSPDESPSPSESPQASGPRTGGGDGGLSGLDIITRPPFVFLPIIGILGLLGVLAFWALNGRRRPPAPAAATVVHRATRPDYTTPFPPARTPGAPVPPPGASPPPVAQPPIAPHPPAQPAWQAPVSPAPQAPMQPPPPPVQPPVQPPPPAAAPPAPRAAPEPPPSAAPPGQVEWPEPPSWAATPDEPPDLPQPSD